MSVFFILFRLVFFAAFAFIIFRIIVSVRNFSRTAFGNPNLTEVIKNESLDETVPRSLSGMDYVYLPQIVNDFPDFNASLAETKVKEKLREALKNKSELAIHDVVINNYLRTTVERTIIYQAALQYKEEGRLLQRRYCVHYAFLLDTGSGSTIAGNCPNCGGAISSTNQKTCEYCDSLLVNVLGSTWRFTEIYEC